MDNYISISEAAKIWEISERRVRALCMNEQIEGAIKIGKQWCIPKFAQKPSDKRTIKEEERKTIVVAGVSNDIGKSLIHLLLSKNFKVIGLCSSQEAPPIELQHRNLVLKSVNFEDAKDIIKVCDSVKDTLAGLVVCELYFNLENVDEFDYDEFEKSFRINLFAPNILIRELVKKMDYSSSIVLLSSVESDRGSFGASAYASAQAAKINLISSLCNVYSERYGVRINSIKTGWIGSMGFDNAFKKAIESIPMKRLGIPDEIAEDIYLFLTAHRYTTGTYLISDGGYLQVDEQSKTEFLQTGIFYKYIEKFFTSEQTKKIRAISMMMPNEWIDDPLEKRFREYNIEAMQKGLDFKRVFIFDINDMPKLKKEHLLMDFIKKTLPCSYFVDVKKLQKENPKVLNIIKSGYILFDDEVAVVDYETNDIGRGFITFNKKQIDDYKMAIEYLESVAVTIKKIINKKQEG